MVKEQERRHICYSTTKKLTMQRTLILLGTECKVQQPDFNRTTKKHAVSR